MYDNTIQPAAGDATVETHRLSSAARYRVHGSIRLYVTVTAANPDDATQAAPAVLRDAFANLSGAVIPPDGVAVGYPQPLPSAGSQPRRYQVPVTVHGHLHHTGDRDVDPSTAALNAIAAYLDGHDNLRADLSSAVCDDITELDNTEVDNTEVDNTEVDNTEVDNTELDNTELDDTKVDDTEIDIAKVDGNEVDDTETRDTRSTE